MCVLVKETTFNGMTLSSNTSIHGLRDNSDNLVHLFATVSNYIKNPTSHLNVVGELRKCLQTVFLTKNNFVQDKFLSDIYFLR